MAYTSQELGTLAIGLVQEAEKEGAKLRLLGGLAYYLESPQAAELPALRRSYKDLDFAVDKKGARVVPDVFRKQGWEEDRHFNALHGRTRLLFYYQQSLQADVFIGEFEQCHTIDLEGRLNLASPTLPLADLLLTKLQIHQMNTKDVQDIFTLLLSHDLSEGSAQGGIDQNRILELTSKDWGWYTTLHDNLEKLEGLVPAQLDGEDGQVVHDRLEKLKMAMEQAPKGVRWQLRSQVGRRIPWYDEPEEVNR
jgi:hypothetical protein